VHRYVDVAKGNDTGPGTIAVPWKTLTRAIAGVSGGGTIHVAPGIYGGEETFPLRPQSNQILVGNLPSLGAGATPTEIHGSGTHSIAQGALSGKIAEAIVFGPGVTGAQLNGFSFGAGVENAILVDGATVSCDADSTNGQQMATSALVVNGGNLTLTHGSFVGGISGLRVVDPGSSVRVRQTRLGEATQASIVIGSDTPPSPVGTVDLGSATDPGENTILGGPGAVGLAIVRAGTTMLAAGNVWHPDVQGTDAVGHYRAALAIGLLPFEPGNNYSSTDADNQMQL